MLKRRVRELVYQRDGNRCVYCGSDYKLTLDHDIPEALGGALTVENCVTCCYSCNRQKKAMTGVDFLLWIMAHPQFVASNRRAKRRARWRGQTYDNR